MPRSCCHLHFVLACVAANVVAAFAWAQDPSASATLPLKQILELYQERDALKENVEVLPPRPAAIEHIEMRGRLLDDAVEIEAQVAFIVMQADSWVRLPLLKVDDSLQLVEFTKQENITVLVDNGELTLFAKNVGRFSVDFKLRKAASQDKGLRSARIELASATTADLLLSYDNSVFELQPSGQVRDSDGARYFARDGVFAILWRQRKAMVLQNLPQNSAQMPTEPLISDAYASLVSTLEGEFLLRLKYVMHFTGQQSLQLTLPPGDEVKRVYLNGFPIEHKVDNSALIVEVSHRRAGDQEATLELVLERPKQAYVLSGRIDVEFPRASWTINALQVQLYLPEVFNYRWAGGSLAQIEHADEVSFTQSMPTPGKNIAFEQVLISTTTPRLSVDYSIDLTDKYYRGS